MCCDARIHLSRDLHDQGRTKGNLFHFADEQDERFTCVCNLYAHESIWVCRKNQCDYGRVKIVEASRDMLMIEGLSTIKCVI